jgi:hypothetical protein
MKTKIQSSEKLATDQFSPERAVVQSKRLSARLLFGLLVAAAVTSSLPAQQNLEDGDDNGYDRGTPGDPPERSEFPDTILEWNAFLGDSVIKMGLSPGASARFGAVVQTAVFDTVNGIEGHYTQILVADVSGAPARHPDTTRAAAAQAAHDAMLNINLVPPLPAALAASIKTDADNELQLTLDEILATGGGLQRQLRVAAGLSWGAAVASQVVAARKADHYNAAPPPYTVNPADGYWKPVPGNPPSAPTNRQFPFVTPFSESNADLRAQFRTPGPPALGSDKYNADLAETFAYGAADSTVRTADQAHLAQFWDNLPPFTWNGIARQLIVANGLSLSDEARALAQLNISIFDAQIAIFSEKFTYNFWRPYTAIHTGDPASTWNTLIPTPPFPEYPAGHAETSGAASGALIALFGDAVNVTATSNKPGTHPLQYTSLNAAAVDAGNARVYGGMHFRAACDDGRASGQLLGRFVVNTLAARSHDHDR